MRTGQGRTSLDPNNPASIYFNAAAFSVPGQFSFGTSSQYNGHFRQPPVLVDNIAVVKQLHVWPHGDGNGCGCSSAPTLQPVQPDKFRGERSRRQRQLRARHRPQYGPRIITMIAPPVLLEFAGLFQSAR